MVDSADLAAFRVCGCGLFRLVYVGSDSADLTGLDSCGWVW